MNVGMHPRSKAAAPSRWAAGLAFWLGLLLTLALLATLGLAHSAGAATAGPSTPIAAPPFEEECEADEPECEEEAGEECEEIEEWEEAEEEECEEAGVEEAPAECLLTSAQPQLTVLDEPRRLRLQVHYVLAGPAEVAASLHGSGGRGSFGLDAGRRHLSHSGSFQETIGLSPGETTRALAAKRFTLRLSATGAPSSCHRYDLHQLDVRRRAHGDAVFSETGAQRSHGR
jgi:hypothetical protein